MQEGQIECLNIYIEELKKTVDRLQQENKELQEKLQRTQLALKEAGDRVIDHHLHGKDKTAAGYYTAVTGKKVIGVELSTKKNNKET